MMAKSTIAKIKNMINEVQINKKISFYEDIKHMKGIQHMIILDSSFNPPTKAHHELLFSSLNLFNKDERIGYMLLLTNNNVDKPGVLNIDIELRLQFMKLMKENIDLKYNKQIDGNIALINSGKFIDKLNTLNEIDNNIKFHFIMGYDTLIRFFDYKYYLKQFDKNSLINILNPFFTNGCIIYTNRGLFDKNEIILSLIEHYNQHIRYFELPKGIDWDISSTKARQLLSSKEVDYAKLNLILNPNILNFILQNNPYKK